MNIKKRVLVGSPIRQEPAILKEFLNSLMGLEQETVELSFLFIDDNDNINSSRILDEFASLTPNVMIHKHSSLDTYVRDEVTHSWNEQLVWKVAQLKNMIIQIAIEFNYDYLFFIDSDIVLHPRTIEQLKNAGKEIISEIFWTKWQPDFPELPQVWIEDHYTMYYKHRNEQITQQEALSRQEKFLSCLRKPGVYEVGGLGACTLISRDALLKGVNFKEIKNISFWGEDRHFCIRAQALGFQLFVDTHYPAYHIYRESDLQNLPRYKNKISNGVYDSEIERVVINGLEGVGTFHYKFGYSSNWRDNFTQEIISSLLKAFEEELPENIKNKLNVKGTITNTYIRLMEKNYCEVDFLLVNNGVRNDQHFMENIKGSVCLIQNEKNDWLINNLLLEEI